METTSKTPQRPRALESPLAAIQLVEDAAHHRLDRMRGRWPSAMSQRVMSLVCNNHRTNADGFERLTRADETVDVNDRQGLQQLQDMLLRAHALTQVVRLQDSHLEQLERGLVRIYEMVTDPDVGYLTDHAKAVLRSGNLIRAAQNLRVIRLMPHRRDETVALQDSDGSRSVEPALDVHRSSDASFPASDAPSWTGSHA